MKLASFSGGQLWSPELFSDDLLLTPSAARILGRCSLSSKDRRLDEIAGQLVIACLEEESLAGAVLRNAGIDATMLQDVLPNWPKAQLSATADEINLQLNPESLPAVSIAFLNIAAGFAHREIESNGISSEHLLAAVFEFDSPVRTILTSHGLSAEAIVRSFGETHSTIRKPLPIAVSFDLDDPSEPAAFEPPTPVASHNPARVLDVCMNRAREGLRVLEDYARFVCDHAIAVDRLKTLRHRLADSERQLTTRTESAHPSDKQLVARDVAGDVGTEFTAKQELSRSNAHAIVHANARRVQESLRSLEEFGKLVSSEFAREMKQLRYESYQIHQLLLTDSASYPARRSARRSRLGNSRLCVLVTESGCTLPWKEVVRRCLDGGADIIQLREKNLDDCELLQRASWLSETCRSAAALAIINDRPDIALLGNADGVHLGQDDLTVDQTRQLIGDDLLIGLSTHSFDDIQSAQKLNADYLGVGPVFPSTTKNFRSWVGLELLRDATSSELPWLAIGGIQPSNINDVVEAGSLRVAVSAAVIAADKPEHVVAQLIAHMK